MRFLPSIVLPLVMAVLPSLFFVSAAVAQQKEAENGSEKEAAEKDKLPKREPIELQTADAVKLVATYYPGSRGKQSVPIILLHMFKGSGNDYAELAPDLQAEGHAVLVPDLRGHGGSTTRKGMSAPLNAAGMPRMEFTRMVHFDMPALKQFLIEKNNAEELNIEKLCVVGAEMGASVALNFAALDWSLLPAGNRKQGQDVKAMVLISPDWSTPGLPLRAALTARPLRIWIWDDQLKRVFKNPDEKNFSRPVDLDFRKEVSVLIVVGGGKSKAVGDAKRLHRMLKPHHPDPPKNEKAQKQDFFYGTLDTSLQGTKMLAVKGLGLKRYVVEFIALRAAGRSFPWKQRKNPYD